MNWILLVSLGINGALLLWVWSSQRKLNRLNDELDQRRDLHAESKIRMNIALEGAELGLWEWHIDNDTLVVSPSGAEMLGLKHEEIPKTTFDWEQRIHPHDIKTRRDRLQAYLKRPSERYEFEYRVNHTQGDWLWVLERGRILYKDAPDNEKVMVATFFDISSRKEMELELTQLATTDPLTGLVNRRIFRERLLLEWNHTKRQPRHQATVAICDIDYFKSINDTYGHDAGDKVLKFFADTLAGSIRENDLAARLGGEEFAVILQDNSLVDATHWAERFRMQISEAQIAYGSNILTFTVSIGLADIRTQGDSPDAALKAADSALYRAKQKGRNQVMIDEH